MVELVQGKQSVKRKGKRGTSHLLPYRFKPGNKLGANGRGGNGLTFHDHVRDLLGEPYVKRFCKPEDMDSVTDVVTTMEILAERVIQRALDGDSYSLGVILDRIDPLPKDKGDKGQRIVINMVAETVKAMMVASSECQGNGTSGDKDMAPMEGESVTDVTPTPLQAPSKQALVGGTNSDLTKGTP